MKQGSVFLELVKWAWKGICQQIWLLAALSMLFLALALGTGPVARELLSQGVDFSGITLAVSAPEGDDTGLLVEQLTGAMRDIRQFASLVALPEEEARRALAEGEVTAVLLLPEGFLSGVLDGTNPDVELLVDSSRPLEALLTCWAGQAAADLLTGAQQGIYGVLELYPGEESSVSWGEVKAQINLEFINLALNRQGMFRHRELRATGVLPLEIHYGLSMLLFLQLCLPPLLSGAFGSQPIRRRLAVLGYGAGVQYGSSLLLCFGVQLGLILVPGLVLSGGNLPGCLLSAAFGALWSGLCCAMTRTSAGCGALALGGGGLLTAACGGILPPALLPRWLQQLGDMLPLGLVRELMYTPAEDWSFRRLGPALVWCLCLGAGGLALLHRKLHRGEDRT